MNSITKNKFCESVIVKKTASRQDKFFLFKKAKKLLSNNNQIHCFNEKNIQGKIKKSKVLLFKRIMSSSEKENNQWITTGTQYLASSLKKEGAEIILSNSGISLKENEFIVEKEELVKVLRENPDINFIAITLSESYFEKAEKLIKFLREKTNAFIGVGGMMPTLAPEQTFVHLPEINFLIRGAGEEIFPKIAKILDGCNTNSHLNENHLEKLASLKGFIFYNEKELILSSIDIINKIDNYDKSILDFSFLKKENAMEGLNLFSSWGCHNNCIFCTSWVRGNFNPKSFLNLKKIVHAYHKRLKELFGNEKIPISALKLSFNDDDFLGDADRAIKFFDFLRKTPFYINFFQTGINSFFIRKKGRCTDMLNQKLLKHLTVDLFYPRYLKNSDDRYKNHTYLYIGTENYSNKELNRLGKGYDFNKIQLVIKILSLKKIYQAHHFIASNSLTDLDEIIDNLIKISRLRILYGDYFNILTPIIPYLVSFYPSMSYKIAVFEKRKKFLNIRKVLSIKNHSDYDYPLVENDIPINKATEKIIPILSDLFLYENDYVKILDAILLNFLLLQKKLPKQAKEITRLINKYENYPSIILKGTNLKPQNDRNNLQLMITRRCQLRCRYCPVVKKDLDMNEKTLYQAINLLFTSSRKELRLDFTGGEPLLRFDLIKKAVEYAKNLANKKDKKISFYMVTNLIALTEEIADFLKKENFFLELSIDGKEKFHNLYKVGANKKINPYQLTTSQLKTIFPKRVNNYAVMVVSPATIKYMQENFYHLLKLGFRKIGINYALGSFWEEKNKKLFFHQMDLIKKRFYPFIEKGVIKLNNLESRVEPAILNSEIMINTDGRVHFLTDWLFERKLKKIPPLGQIKNLKSLNRIFLSRLRAFNRLLEYYPSPEIKKIILNNIDMGNSVKEYFEKWKNK